MTAQERAKSIEASFAMEGLEFDDECRSRVVKVLTGELSVKDAIESVKKKYTVCGDNKDERPRV